LKIDPLLFPSLQSNVKPCAILRGLWRAVLCVRSVLPNGSAPPRKPVFVPYVADPGGKSTLTAQDPVITSWLVASTKATEESRILSLPRDLRRENGSPLAIGYGRYRGS
jgi:hypothetical protein